MANMVNGSANAIANPSIPIAGDSMSPLVDTSTSRKPMMGPVHEKLTNVRVNAMRNIPISPPVFSALLSTAVLHDAGSCSSNAPKKDIANTTSIRKKKMLNTALVDNALSALAPKMAVTIRPSARYITTIDIP